MSDQGIEEKPTGNEEVDKQVLIKLRQYYQTAQPKIAKLENTIRIKDAVMDKLKSNLLELQKERDTYLSELEETKNELKLKGNRFEGQVPQRVLERIVAGNRTWCLVEYPEIEVEDELDEDIENLNMIWLTQEELVERVNEAGINLNLPSLGLSSNEATILRNKVKQLEETLSSLETEYKKYRVDMEMMIWNKNTQIENLQNVTNENENSLGRDINTQLQVDYESLKMQKEGLLTRTSELETTIRNLEADKEILQKEAADINRRLEMIANEAEEWKRKYKNEVKKKRDDILNKEGEDMEEESTIHALKKEIETLKKQISTTRLVAPAPVSTPTAAPVAASTAPPTSATESTLSTEDYEYLRNIVRKYFSSKNREAKDHMSTAILTVLKFTPQEISSIRRLSESSWWGR